MKPIYIIIADIYIYLRDKISNLTIFYINLNSSETHKFHIFRFIWCITFALIIFVNTAYGTAIVFVREPYQITVAADSGKTWVTNGFRQLIPVCKIGQNGSFFFAVSGLAETNSFNAINIAHSIQVDSLYAFIEKFGEIIYTPLLTAFSSLPQTENTPNSFHIAFFGFENGQAHLHVRGWIFQIDSSGQRILTPDIQWDCPGKDCHASDQNKIQILPLGLIDNFNEYVAINKKRIKESPADFVRNIVSMAIKANPDKMSEPIVLLRVKPFATEWIDNKGICPPIKDFCQIPLKEFCNDYK